MATEELTNDSLIDESLFLPEYPPIPTDWHRVRVAEEDEQQLSNYDLSLKSFNSFIVGWLHGHIVRERQERPDGLEIAPLNGILFRFSSFICEPYKDTAYIDVSIYGLDNLPQDQAQTAIAQLKVSIFSCLVIELENEPYRGIIESTEITAGPNTEIIEQTQEENLHLPQYVKLSPLSPLSNGDALFTIKFNLSTSRHIEFEDGTEGDYDSKFMQLYIGTNTTSLNRDNPAASPNWVLTEDNNYHETLGEWGAVLMPGPDGRLSGSNEKIPIGYDNIDKGNTDDPPVFPPQNQSGMWVKFVIPEGWQGLTPAVWGMGGTIGRVHCGSGTNYGWFPCYGGSINAGTFDRSYWTGSMAFIDNDSQPVKPTIISQQIHTAPSITTNPKRVRRKNRSYEQKLGLSDEILYKFESSGNEPIELTEQLVLTDDIIYKLAADISNMTEEQQLSLVDDMIYAIKATKIKLTPSDKIVIRDSIAFKLFSSNIKEKISEELNLNDDVKYSLNTTL